MLFPILFLTITTILFLIIERVFPGRPLPPMRGWYARAIGINSIQLFLSYSVGKLWILLFHGPSLFSIRNWDMPVLEGFVCWFVGTFVFYWWHRLRHKHIWWQIFHQIHHSPTRIEIATSFYKHPLEIFVNTLISGTLIYVFFGASITGALWYNVFAAIGEYFYHANIKTPHWLRWFIQTPELHSIHHAASIHGYNYADIPLWDKLFHTYKDTHDFITPCGFDKQKETQIKKMLLFQDVEK